MHRNYDMICKEIHMQIRSKYCFNWMLSWISKTRHLNFRLFLDRYALCLSKCVVNTVCKLWREIYFISHFLHTIHPHTKPTTAVGQRGNRLRKFDLQNNFFFRKAWRVSGEVMILTKSQNNRNVTGKKVKVFKVN